MTDAMKIGLIKAYNELLQTLGNYGNQLKETLEWEYGVPVGYKKVRKAIDHLSEEITNMSFKG